MRCCAGIDLAASVAVAELDGGSVALTFLADAVAAHVDTHGNDRLPRLPPSRLGVGLTIERGRYDAKLDYLHTFEQDEPADFELPTDAYGDLRLHVGADYVFGNARVRLFLQGRNLTDEEQRDTTHRSSRIWRRRLGEPGWSALRWRFRDGLVRRHPRPGRGAGARYDANGRSGRPNIGPIKNRMPAQDFLMMPAAILSGTSA